MTNSSNGTTSKTPVALEGTLLDGQDDIRPGLHNPAHSQRSSMLKDGSRADYLFVGNIKKKGVVLLISLLRIGGCDDHLT